MKSHLINWSKFHRPVDHNILSNGAISPTGFFGIVCQEPGFVYEKHILALSRVLKFHFKRKKKKGSFFINLFLNRAITKKAIGVRMGKGKGPNAANIFFMRPGHLVLFINDLNDARGSYIVAKCMRRLPTTCKVVRFNSW